MLIAGLFCPGLARKHTNQRRLALHQLLQRGLNVVKGFETVHAFPTAAQFAGGLRPTKKKDANDRNLTPIEIEDFLQTVFVLCYAAVSSSSGTRKALLLQ